MNNFEQFIWGKQTQYLKGLTGIFSRELEAIFSYPLFIHTIIL